MMNLKQYQFAWGERCSMFIAECFVDKYGPHVFAKPKRSDYVIVSENRYHETFDSKAMNHEHRVLGKALLDHRKRQLYLDRSKNTQELYFKFFGWYKNLKVRGLTDNELFLALKNLRHLLLKITIYFGLSDPASTDALLKRLTNLLANEQLDEQLPLLITQTVPDILLYEQHDLDMLGKRRKVTDRVLLDHALKYAIIFYNSYNLQENLRYLRGRLGEKFNMDARLAEMNDLRAKQEEIFKGIKNQEIKSICLFFQALGVDRLELKNCWAGAEFRFLELFTEIARRIYIPLPQMMATFTFKDYYRALVKHEDYAEKYLHNRMNRFVLWKKGNRIRLLDDPKKMKPFFKLIESAAKKVASQVAGISANGGIVKGRVRIVKSLDIANLLKDLDRFHEGDILVTWMTQPNMVPIARRAAAIIANEGGITSHAAVIAREFGVPCIVGTKIATRVFKDGDMVEVDANKGIVRKI